MKKILAFLLCLFTIISLVSCDNQGISSDSEETTCDDRLSSKEAYEIAVEYWRLRPSEPDGACGTIYYTDAFVMATPDEDDVYYHFLRINKGYSHDGNGNISSTPHNIVIDSELLIDSTTGECIELNEGGYYGCGYNYEYAIYPYKAIDIAEEYWGVNQFQEETGEGTSSYLEIDISKFPHCTDKYYRVVLMRKYYANAEGGIFKGNDEILKEILIDASTGECFEIGADDKQG